MPAGARPRGGPWWWACRSRRTCRAPACPNATWLCHGSAAAGASGRFCIRRGGGPHVYGSNRSRPLVDLARRCGILGPVAPQSRTVSNWLSTNLMDFALLRTSLIAAVCLLVAAAGLIAACQRRAHARAQGRAARHAVVVTQSSRLLSCHLRHRRF